MTKKKSLPCPHCGMNIETYHNPLPTVDIIIEMPEERGIILIHRKNEPRQWALPGGFVDYGETVERAAEREAMEETSLAVLDLRQFHAYSDPARDPRGHTISVVFTATGSGLPKAGVVPLRFALRIPPGRGDLRGEAVTTPGSPGCRLRGTPPATGHASRQASRRFASCWAWASLTDRSRARPGASGRARSRRARSV